MQENDQPPLPDSRADMQQVQIGDIVLSFRARDGGGRHYLQRNHVEEHLSPLYPILRAVLGPRRCIDIGANYGYTGLLMRQSFPESHLTLVEPIPWLANYIEYNFAANRVMFDALYSAICSVGTNGPRTQFGVRETATQDSRVILQPGMIPIETNVVTLDELAHAVGPEEGVYIKIDTQGWEERVFAGGETFLSRHHRWFAKTEFAPAWLESQGSDPVVLLRWLIERFDVHESAGRISWNCASLREAIGKPLQHGEEADFARYVRNLAREDKGWVDLFVLPQTSRRTYDVDMVCARGAQVW